MNEWMNSIRTYLDGLNPRERYMLIGGSIVLLIFLLYQLIWAPIADGVTAMQNKVNRQQQDLLWMQQAAEEVKQLRGGNRHRPRRSGSLLGSIERTARNSKLGDSIRKVQPEGQNGVRMWLDGAAFDDVLTWLDGLQYKQGIMVSNISIERLSEQGRVNVRLLLEAQ